MLISPAFKMLGLRAVSGPQGLFLCMLQNSNVEVSLSVDFEQGLLRSVFQHLLHLAGEARGEPQSARGSASTHGVEKHLSDFSSSELTITYRGFLYVKSIQNYSEESSLFICMSFFFFFNGL